MGVRLVFALFPLVFLGSPIYAQGPCSECLAAAEEERKKCLDNAFSVGDKISCDDSRQAQVKTCTDRECRIEREKDHNRSEQQTPNRAGLAPYTPTQIEWLALIVNSYLRHEATADNPYDLSVVQEDHETLLIVVRYHPTLNREMMNGIIDSAREAIRSRAKSYGWDKWIKIRENVGMYPPKN